MRPNRTSLGAYALLVAVCLSGQTNAADASVKTIVITIHASAPRESTSTTPTSSSQRHQSSRSPSPPPSAPSPSSSSSFTRVSSRVQILSKVDVFASASVSAPPQATVSLLAATAPAAILTVFDASDASTTGAHPKIRHSQGKQATATEGTQVAPHTTTNSSAVNASTNTAHPTNETQPFDPVYDCMVKAHGSLMYLAWGVFAPLGALSSRYLKRTIRGEKIWFPVHIFLFLTCFVLNIIAFGLIYVASGDDHFDYMSNGFHPVLGLTIIVALFVQIALGYVINQIYNPARIKTPIWDQAHHWLGRILLLVAIINIPLGITLYAGGLPPDMEVSNWTWIALQLWLLLLVGVAAYAEGRLREAMQKHALPVVHPPIGSTDWGGGGGGVATRGSLSAECTVSNATSPKKEVEKESDRAQVVAMVGGLMQDSAGLDMDARGLKEEDLYDSMDRVDDVLAIRRLGSLDCGVVPRAQSCVASLSPVARVYSWHGPVEGARTAERDVLPRQVTAPVARVRKDVAVAADVIDAIVREAVERMLKRVGEDEIEMLTRTVQGAAQARNSYERVASVVDKYRRDVASSVLSEDNSNLREVKEEVEIVTAESGAIGGMAGVVEVEPGLEVHSLYGLMSEASQSTLASPVRSL